jgi:multisubunit Na+/H+ antiporter MnhG subunit
VSNPVADIFIYLLLVVGVGFGGIALMGLLIFPDIHSRMYTALRASLICVAAVVGASVVYVMARLIDTGGDQYAMFLIHTIFLAGMVAVGIMVINRQVLDKTKALVYCGSVPAKTADQEKPDP